MYPNPCHAQTSIMGDVLFSPGSPTPFDQSSTFLRPIVDHIPKNWYFQSSLGDPREWFSMRVAFAR